MSKIAKIAFIIEGTKTEPLIIDNLKKTFFSKYDIVPIMLPTCTNIYSLLQRIEADDYETDMIELAKELSEDQVVKRVDQRNEIDYRTMKKSDFSEIFLFFDYDGHNNNLPSGIDVNITLGKMLEVFNNETEFGKMYISYPMVESINHFSSLKICNHVDQCKYLVYCSKNYKRDVSQHTLVQDMRKLDLKHWRFIVEKFLVSVSCLFGLTEDLTVEKYRNDIVPKEIYNYQLEMCIKKYQQVMILSAFPEFLIDYFKIDVLEEVLQIECLFQKCNIHRYKIECEESKEFIKQ